MSGHSLGGRLLLDLQEGRVVPSPAPRRPPEGWAEAAKPLADASKGQLEWAELESISDNDWEW